MNEATPSPTPRRSRRMVVWMVVVPIVILLLAGGLLWARWSRAEKIERHKAAFRSTTSILYYYNDGRGASCTLERTTPQEVRRFVRALEGARYVRTSTVDVQLIIPYFTLYGPDEPLAVFVAETEDGELSYHVQGLRYESAPLDVLVRELQAEAKVQAERNRTP